MKIMYCKYREDDYKEITIQELQRRLTDDYYCESTGLSIFLITLDEVDIENNTIYFSETDAYDY